jgi:hypothetical protein
MTSRSAHIAAAMRKLNGRWRSDAKKTMSRWVFPKRLAGSRLKVWKSVFGKNEWRFTPTRIYGSFEGRKSVSKYRILWADEWSAVLLLHNESHERVYHIHFDEPWFYFLAGRDICEYFRRIPHERSNRA